MLTKRLPWIPLAGLFSLLVMVGCGQHIGPGDIEGGTLPEAAVAARAERQQSARIDLGRASSKQILFGDMHVHSAFSTDGFITAMPLMGGGGLHPPADACDYARYCSALDFWSISDHAEGISSQHWDETKDSIRQCNAVAGDPANPDLVSFLGWEWSHVDTDRNKHYGHKNVHFLDTDEDKVPARPIAAPRDQLGKAPIGKGGQLAMALMDLENLDYYRSISTFYAEIEAMPKCERGVDVRELPSDCMEEAHNPGELFSKLDQWGFDTLVIPHGNSWGMNTPPGTAWDKQIRTDMDDPARQFLVEVFSGHGNSEEYRQWRHVDIDAQGNMSCPAPIEGFQACCNRAGEIIRERCEAEGLSPELCDRRQQQARQNYVDAGISGHLTVPGSQVTDWLNCGICTDCYLPSFKMRPMTTVQYALAKSNFAQPEGDRNFVWGFIGSSDNHRSRPGTGYKDYDRRSLTETSGPLKPMRGRSFGDGQAPVAESKAIGPDVNVGLQLKRNMERQSSFWVTGGLVATHSTGRDRASIWNALKRKEVYATSGDRTLLWFDLVGADGQTHPMGSQVAVPANPRFKISAAGAFKQQAGCPDHVHEGLGAERLEKLCRGECYHPGDERKKITRIEVVRIQPQQHPEEPLGQLIQDPWRVFPCDDNGQGCTVEFVDQQFMADERPTVYYARAIQEPSLAINAGGLRCEYDEAGQCIAVNPCYADFRTAADDNCLAENEERAWSSPIYVNFDNRTALAQANQERSNESTHD